MEKKLTNKKEVVVVVMPEKTDGTYANSEFNKDQLKQLLIEAGMDARSAAGQATVLWKKQASPWASSILMKHYAESKSKIKEKLMALLGADEESIKEAKKI